MTQPPVPMSQTATWKYQTGHNGDDPTYSTASISCRFVQKRRRVVNRTGDEVVSEATLCCLEAVKPGDVISFAGRDWPVVAVSETPDLDGVVWFREVYL